jgi:hypothetical protein
VTGSFEGTQHLPDIEVDRTDLLTPAITVFAGNGIGDLIPHDSIIPEIKASQYPVRLHHTASLAASCLITQQTVPIIHIMISSSGFVD